MSIIKITHFFCLENIITIFPHREKYTNYFFLHKKTKREMSENELIMNSDEEPEFQGPPITVSFSI